MKDIAIFAAGGFGREVLTLIQHINKAQPGTWNFVGFYDDAPDKQDAEINNYMVLGGVKELNAYNSELCLVFAVGAPSTKRKIISKIENPKITFPILIHPNVIIGDETRVEIGEGCIITAGNIITTDIKIGKHVILNLGCTVGHDTFIGDYCSFMPGINISGEVNIGEAVYVGTGAKIINQLEIGENTTVGAGAVVSKTLPSNCTAVGVPAKPIKFH